MSEDVLAIIPARGGSKGVPHKNIKPLCGKPLIEYTLDSALNSKYITKVIVSTDDIDIANIGLKNGAEVPFLRPVQYATDTSPTIELVIHLLDYLKTNLNYMPKYVMLLQPTSPLRNNKHINEAFEKLLSSKYDGIVSVCEAEVNPYWTNVFDKDNLNYFLEDGKKITRRQDLPKIYRYNGAIFIAKTQVLLQESTFEVQNLTGYIMDNKTSIDIDTELDFKIAEILINSGEF